MQFRLKCRLTGAKKKEVKGFMAQLILPPLLMFSDLMVEFVEPYQRLFRCFLPGKK